MFLLPSFIHQSFLVICSLSSSSSSFSSSSLSLFAFLLSRNFLPPLPQKSLSLSLISLAAPLTISRPLPPLHNLSSLALVPASLFCLCVSVSRERRDTFSSLSPGFCLSLFVCSPCRRRSRRRRSRRRRRSTQSSPPSVSEPACSLLSDAPLLSSAALHVLALLPPSTSLSLLISCSVASRVVCSSVTRGYHLPF